MKKLIVFSIVFSFLLMSGCVRKPASVLERAVAVVYPTEGNNVRGVIKFKQVDREVKVVAEITGLTPNQQHGFHIHEYGDITPRTLLPSVG